MPLANIFVEGLRIVCIIGDLPRERTEPQQVLVDLFAQVNIDKVSQTDHLEDSVDYVAMAALATKIAQQGKFHLVETLVAKIAQEILATWDSIESIHIRAAKEGCIPTARTCGVEIKLHR